MKTKNINIGVALSKNYNKFTLDLVDEQVEYETEEELKQEIEKRFDFLKIEVEKQFEINTEQKVAPIVLEMATDKQKSYLKGLGFEGDIDKLNKIEATELIKSLLEQGDENY